MKIAPVLFTSNMTDKEINEKRDFGFEVSSDENIEILTNVEDRHFIIEENDVGNTTALQESSNNNLMTLSNTNMPQIESKNNDDNKPHIFKRKRKDLPEKSNLEEEVRIQRIKQLMKQEEQLANIKIKHEEKITMMKEEHLKTFNFLQLQHLKEVQKFEIEIHKSKLRDLN